MQFSEQNPGAESAGRKAGAVILTLLLFFAVLGISAFTYLKSRNIDIADIRLNDVLSGMAGQTGAAEGISRILDLPYDYKERPVFSVYRDLLIKCTPDGITAINKKGEDVWTKGRPMTNPIVKSNGKELLAADIGARDFFVLDGDNIKWEAKSEDNIINAELGESGHAVVVTEAKGYRGKVSVYDPMGIEMFSRNIAERFVFSAKVSPRGRQLMINSVDTSSGTASSCMEFTDMAGNPFAARTPRQDQVFPSTWYMSDDSLLTVSDESVVYYDRDRNEKWSVDIPGILSSCTSDGKYGIIAARGKEKGLSATTDIKIFNIKGQAVSEFSIDGEAGGISSAYGVIAANTGREAVFYTLKGRKLGSQTMKSDIVKVDFFNKQEAAIISKGSVTLVRLN